ncbi:MAG: ribosome maturation factor RimP [Betaproteobacteria bacterium]|nr:ribosome maturation factor RimP [Betaproteobacteria bacterium]
MDLKEFLEPTLAGLGYELVDLELGLRGRLIRVFIDKRGGVGVDDCARVSNHLSRVLAVENVDYDRLEVSSPGLDRPLRKPADFERFAGEMAKLKLRVPVEGRRNLVGLLHPMKDGAIRVEVDGKVLQVEMSNLEKARLVPRISFN